MSISQISEIEVGKLALRLRHEADDLSHYSCIPLTKICEVSSNKQIKLDTQFIVPSLHINTTAYLYDFVTEALGLLQHRADMLSCRLTNTQQSASAEIADFMLLQIINRYELNLYHFSQQLDSHPIHLYYLLIQLTAELATFTKDKRRPNKPPVYKQDNLYDTFSPILNELRHALSMVLEQHATAIQLTRQDHGIWVGELTNKEILQQMTFVLAVYADAPIEKIRQHFASQVKIAPIEQIHHLVCRAIPGIGVQLMAVAPRQIPFHTNFSYFLLDKSHSLWKSLEKSAAIAFHIAGNFPQIKLELWAIKG